MTFLYHCVNYACPWYRQPQFCEMSAAEYTRATGRPYLCACGQPLKEGLAPK